MNKDKIIAAFDAINKALDDIKNAINEDEFLDAFEGIKKENQELKKEMVKVGSYTELLANRLAWSYSTIHPEYKVDNQFKNLEDMIKGPKISYVLKWIQRKNSEGLEDFFRLPLEEQRQQLQTAMHNYEDKIKDVFTKRFTL